MTGARVRAYGRLWEKRMTSIRKPRKKQTLARAMSKAAIRIALYRAVNSMLDAGLDYIAEAINKRSSNKSKTETSE